MMIPIHATIHKKTGDRAFHFGGMSIEIPKNRSSLIFTKDAGTPQAMKFVIEGEINVGTFFEFVTCVSEIRDFDPNEPAEGLTPAKEILSEIFAKLFNAKPEEMIVPNKSFAETIEEFAKKNRAGTKRDGAPEAATDMVNHPKHYNAGRIEVIEFIEDQQLPYNLGNVVKYVSRAGKKGGIDEHEQDLKKAQWYLAREIELLQAARAGRTATRPNDMKSARLQ